VHNIIADIFVDFLEDLLFGPFVELILGYFKVAKAAARINFAYLLLLCRLPV